MADAEGFLTRIRDWTERRRQRSETGPRPVVDQPASGGSTERFKRRSRLDVFGLFQRPAEQSAARHAGEGRLVDRITAALIQDLWAAFFSSFRRDEQDFELRRFLEEADRVQRVLDRLHDDEDPDLVTQRQMLFLLVKLTRDRAESVAARLDELLAQHRDMHRQLHGVQLASAWQTDELEYCRTIISDIIRKRSGFIARSPDGSPPLVSELLCQLLSVNSLPERPQAHGRAIARAVEESGELALPVVEQDALERKVPEVDDGAEPVADGHVDLAIVRHTLRDLLDGKATKAKLHRLFGDRQLAGELYALVAASRQHRAILAKIGLLPHSDAGSDDEPPLADANVDPA